MGTPITKPALAILNATGVTLIVDAGGSQFPRVVYWGAELPPMNVVEAAAVVASGLPPVATNSLDAPEPVAIITEPSRGWMGLPGIAGHFDGTGFAPRFEVSDVTVEGQSGMGGTISATAHEPNLHLAVELTIELTPEGLVRTMATLRNESSRTFTLDAMRLSLPVPSIATELLDFAGRHLRERSPQRNRFTQGSHVRTGRRGRTGLDSTPLMIAGQQGFGFQTGEVWGVHTAWSGNHSTFAERDSSGVAVLGGGEELLAGEIRLAPGESYASPSLFGSYGDGLDELSARIHQFVRRMPGRATRPRPVTLNTWEAVYFDQDLRGLADLADLAASVGVERFVLDDGWFGGRRDDTTSLGDWQVSAEIWPQGLGPLVDHVRSLGMEFGLWFEPEMISPDSDIARLHPEWIMSSGHRMPVSFRNQQVIDLANPDAYAYVLFAISNLVAEHSIDYIKWDHNRDLVDAGHPGSGRAGVHDQTVAVYRLIDELKGRHPGLEIESCSSGGGRVDLAILEHTDRVWASDCIDPLERQHIQRWTGMIVPPEMIGEHVGAARSHTTGRVNTLAFRAATAFFGHFGIEWDLRTAGEDELSELRQWVSLHKDLRGRLHNATVVHGDHGDTAIWITGSVTADRSWGMFAVTAIKTSELEFPGRVCFPGLDDDRRYRVSPVSLGNEPPVRSPLWIGEELVMTGATLRRVGVQSPALRPESSALFIVEAVGEPDPQVSR